MLVRHRCAVGAHRLAVGLHRQLLQIGGEPRQVVGVRQHRTGLRVEEVVVPEPDQAEQRRRVGLQRRGTEVLVDDVEPGQEFGEPLAADGRHHRQADRRVHRVAAADPVPEAEHVVGVDAEVVDQLLVRRHRHEVLGHRGVAERVGEPTPRGSRVGQRLQRRERLRRDDEKRCGRVESVQLGHQVGGVDVGDEARRDAGVGVVAQRVVDHHRTQIRAADADVDDGLDAFAGRAGPLAAAQPVGEVAHPVEHRVHVGDDVLAVDRQLGTAGQPQRGVQHRAVLRGVDVHAGEHCVAALLQACRAGQVDQQLQRLAGDAVLAVVDVEITDRQHQLGPAGGVFVRRTRAGVSRRSGRGAAATPAMRQWR